MTDTVSKQEVRYEPEDRPPGGVLIGLGLQAALLQIGFFVFIPVAVFRAGRLDASDMAWPVFAALAVGGLATMLQATKLGPFGARRQQLMAPSPAFAAVSVAALKAGGPPLLATLIAISAPCQVFLASRLSWLHRILTPTITGTVTMLVAGGVMTIAYSLLEDVPEGTPPVAAPLSFSVALTVIVVIALCGSPALRLWGPLIGVGGGALAAAAAGLQDLEPVRAAAWLGLPEVRWPGFDLGFTSDFWGLLPAFVLVGMIEVVKTVGDSIAVQRVSSRIPRAADYRVVQQTTAAVGLTNLVCSVAGTVPNTTAAVSASVVELTGVAARRVGSWAGLFLLLVALSPKAAAVFLVIPGPVVGAFLFALCAILFTVGIRVVMQDGMTVQKATIVGIAFWLGAGFQGGALFPDLVAGGVAGSFLDSGLAVGGIAAILLVMFTDLASARPKRLTTHLNKSAGPKIAAFLTRIGEDCAWNERSGDRLCAAGEEALLTLLETGRHIEAGGKRRLQLSVRADRRNAEMEFLAAVDGENLQDRLVLLRAEAEEPVDGEVSLRLLQHYATSVRHQKYRDVDIVTVRVNAAS